MNAVPTSTAITPARAEDAATLTQIAIQAKRHWGYPEKWITEWREVLTIRPDQVVRGRIHKATVAGAIIGFYGLQDAEEMLRLEHLWVLPEAMGCGIGRALFTHASRHAYELGFEFLHIESDPHAQGFYERMGAQRIGAIPTVVDGQRRELPVMRFQNGKYCGSA